MAHCPRCHTPLDEVDGGEAEFVACPVCWFREVVDFQREGIRLKVLGEAEASNAGERLAEEEPSGGDE